MPMYPTNTLRERIALVRVIQASLREGRYTSLGSYPKFYVTKDGGTLSHESVKENMRIIRSAILRGDKTGGWLIVGIDINYEDPLLFCDDTGARIPSAYAEDSVEVEA